MDIRFYKINPETRAILMLWIPCPLGEGLTYAEISEHLGISTSKISKLIRKFKKEYPESWERIISLFKVSRRNSFGIKHPNHYEDMISENIIREKF